LCHVFGAQGGPESLVEACEANFEVTGQIAVNLHRRWRRSPWPVQIEIADLDGGTKKPLAWPAAE